MLIWGYIERPQSAEFALTADRETIAEYSRSLDPEARQWLERAVEVIFSGA